MTETERKPGGQKGNRNSLKGRTPASANLNIRVSPEEKAEFGEAAEKAGMKLTEWILLHLRKALKK